MTDTTTDENFEDETEESEESQEQPKKNWRRQLEEDRNTARDEANKLRRELALTKSGLDEKNPQHKFFIDNYKGELTADAVKAEAINLGFLQSETTSVPQEEIDKTVQLDNASVDAPAITPSGPQGDLEQQLAEAKRNNDRAGYMAILRQNGLTATQPG